MSAAAGRARLALRPGPEAPAGWAPPQPALPLGAWRLLAAQPVGGRKQGESGKQTPPGQVHIVSLFVEYRCARPATGYPRALKKILEPSENRLPSRETAKDDSAQPM